MTVAENCNQLLAWLGGLRGLEPSDQVIALRLAEQANDRHEVDGVDWPRLMRDTGLGRTTVRQRLRPGGALINGGHISVVRRTQGRTVLPTLYRLNL